MTTSRTDLLRAETREAHEALERRPDFAALRDGSRPRAADVNFLRAIALLHEALADALGLAEGAAAAARAIALAEQRRARATDDLAWALGYLYVLEGATLGGRVLRRASTPPGSRASAPSSTPPSGPRGGGACRTPARRRQARPSPRDDLTRGPVRVRRFATIVSGGSFYPQQNRTRGRNVPARMVGWEAHLPCSSGPPRRAAKVRRAAATSRSPGGDRFDATRASARRAFGEAMHQRSSGSAPPLVGGALSADAAEGARRAAPAGDDDHAAEAPPSSRPVPPPPEPAADDAHGATDDAHRAADDAHRAADDAHGATDDAHRAADDAHGAADDAQRAPGLAGTNATFAPAAPEASADGGELSPPNAELAPAPPAADNTSAPARLAAEVAPVSLSSEVTPASLLPRHLDARAAPASLAPRHVDAETGVPSERFNAEAHVASERLDADASSARDGVEVDAPRAAERLAADAPRTSEGYLAHDVPAALASEGRPPGHDAASASPGAAGEALALTFAPPEGDAGGASNRAAAGDDPEHERFFYLTDEDFVRQQVATAAFDDFDFDPPRPPVPPTHRRRLRRVVGYAMGTALVLCMVGVGHYLGRGALPASANDAAASTHQAAMPGAPSTAPTAASPARAAHSTTAGSPAPRGAPAASPPAPAPARKGRLAPDHRHGAAPAARP